MIKRIRAFFSKNKIVQTKVKPNVIKREKALIILSKPLKKTV